MAKVFSILAAAVTATCLAVSGLAAATYNIVGSFSGGQLGDVAFDLTVTADFSADIAATEAGLTINGMTSSVVAGNPFALTQPLTYAYGFLTDRFVIGGFAPLIIPQTETDFAFLIDDFTGTPTVVTIFDSLASQSDGIARDLTGTLAVTQLNPIPLPASAVLLLTGLFAAAGLGYRIDRAVD